MEIPKKLKHYFTLDKQVQFLTRISALVENGFSVMDSLEIMSTLIKSEVTDFMRLGCTQGMRFADILRAFDFEQRIIYIVASSEANHLFLRGLQKASAYGQNYLNNRKEFAKKCRYPLFLFSLIIVVLAAVFIFFVPQLEHFSLVFGIERSNHMLISIVIAIGMLLLLTAILATMILAVLYWNHTPFQRWSYQKMFKIWGMKPLCQRLFSYYFASQLTLFISCGLSIKESLDTINQFEKLPLAKLLMAEMKDDLANGEDILSSIKAKACFTDYFKLIVEHALRLGKLEHELDMFVDSELKEISGKLTGFMKLFQGIFLALVGGLIVMLYLSILQPVFDMISVI